MLNSEALIRREDHQRTNDATDKERRQYLRKSDLQVVVGRTFTVESENT
jgi:hypothetical protein